MGDTYERQDEADPLTTIFFSNFDGLLFGIWQGVELGQDHDCAGLFECRHNQGAEPYVEVVGKLNEFVKFFDATKELMTTEKSPEEIVPSLQKYRMKCPTSDGRMAVFHPIGDEGHAGEP